MEWVEWQVPAFTWARQNMAMTVALLDALPAPSTDEVGEMYQWLKSILSTIAVQHAESFLQHRVEAYVLTPARPADGGQRAT
jgi:hypothetical protein